MRASRIVTLFIGLFTAALTVGVASKSAHASTLNVTCNVSLVAWATAASGEVQVNCGGTWYYGNNVTSGSCTGNGLDAVKAWQSLAQASLLSGKKLYIEYASGTTCISYERLTNQ